MVVLDERDQPGIAPSLITWPWNLGATIRVYEGLSRGVRLRDKGLPVVGGPGSRG